MVRPGDILGKPVRERYGRFVGTVVAYEANVLGEVTAIVYDSNGLLIRTESNSFAFDGKEIEVAPPAIIESKKLASQISDLIVRAQTLRKLRVSGLISDRYFNRMREEFASVYRSVNDNFSSLLEKLNSREQSLIEKREWLYSLFMNLEMSRRLGWIPDDLYMKSYEQLERELFRISNEIDDIKQAKLDLESLHDNLKELMDQMERLAEGAGGELETAEITA